MNNVTLVGRLTRDPELRYLANSKMAVANFIIAVGREGNKSETDFIDIVVFGKVAENCVNYIGKGSLVAIQGSIRVDVYQTKDGKSAKSIKVNANKVQFLDTKSNNKPSLEEINDPELPF